MPLLISNDVTARVLRVSEAVTVMDDAFRQLSNGLAAFQPRTDFWSPKTATGDYFRWGSLLGMTGNPPTFALRFKSDIIQWKEENGRLNEKWYNMEPGRYCGFIILIDTTNGEIIGLLNDGIIQHVRVGATAGVGAKYLSRPDSHVLGILGSGGMAHTYAEAICAVRPIEEIRVFSPTAANRERFAAELSETLKKSVVAVDSAQAALKDVDIVATCTDSRVPVYTVDMLALHRPGVFIVRTRPDEMDDATFEAVDRVIVTSKENYAEYVIGSEEERNRRPMDKEYRRRYRPNQGYDSLADVVAGKVPGRRTATETIFHHNQSAGIQFAAVGRLVYERAKEAKLGVSIPMDWFQQDIRN
jgi:alanine dehydrogenase